MIVLPISPHTAGARTWRRPLLRQGRAKLTRVLAWLALFGGLFALELTRAGPPDAGDALAYQAAALFSLLMFFFMPTWMLATLLVTSAGFLGWHALASTALTGGAAMVVIGISPVLAFLFIYLQPSAPCRRPPSWMAEDSFFYVGGHRR